MSWFPQLVTLLRRTKFLAGVKNVEFTKISVLIMESSLEVQFPGDRMGDIPGKIGNDPGKQVILRQTLSHPNHINGGHRSMFSYTEEATPRQWVSVKSTLGQTLIQEFPIFPQQLEMGVYDVNTGLDLDSRIFRFSPSSQKSVIGHTLVSGFFG